MENLRLYRKLFNTTYGDVSVYENQLTNQPVVIKSVNLRFARAMKAIDRRPGPITERAIPERDMLIRIKSLGGHPNVVDFKAVHYGVQDQMYLEMEYCSRGDLFEYVRAKGKLAFDEVKTKFYQIVSGVGFLHEIGWAHRDLSLENILIDENGICKLCDFGLVMCRIGVERKTVGKKRYMAPEIASPDQVYSAETIDAWSLGVILFSLFFNMFPFTQPTNKCNRFKYYRKFGIRSLIAKARNAPILSTQALDLLDNLLQIDPNARLSMEEILNHPFFCSESTDIVYDRSDNQY